MLEPKVVTTTVSSPPTPRMAPTEWLGAQPGFDFGKRDVVSVNQKVSDAKPRIFGAGGVEAGTEIGAYSRTDVVDAEQAMLDMLEAMEQRPTEVAQGIADAAWEASVGAVTRYPIGMNRFVTEPNVAKYLDVYEEAVRRYMQKFVGGVELVNIGSANGNSSRSLWVTRPAEKRIKRKLASFLKDYDADEAFDSASETYTAEFSNAFISFVEDTTGRSVDVLIGNKEGAQFVGTRQMVNRAPLTMHEFNELVYKVKSHLAGKLAQARYAIGATAPGHRLIVDGLNSSAAGSRVRQAFAKMAKEFNGVIDLAVEDLPKPAQLILEQVANKLRNNADLLLTKAKNAQEPGGDALEAVMQVLDDEGLGRYTTVDPQLVREAVQGNGISVQGVVRAVRANRLALPQELAERLENLLPYVDAESQGFLSPGIERGLTDIEAVVKEVADHMNNQMQNALLDVMEGAYPSKKRSDLQDALLKVVASSDPHWARKAWLEFFADGRFGEAWDFLQTQPIGSRSQDELAAGAKYAIKRRLESIKQQAVQELIDAGLAVPKNVAEAAQDILNGKVDNITWYNQKEAAHTQDDYVEALRWLDQTGASALQYVDQFSSLDEADNFKVPNELARVFNEAARVGGRNPANLYTLIMDPNKSEKLRPVAKLFGRMFNLYKMSILGGLAIVNTTYHVTNIIDIPALVHRNLGTAGTLGMFAAAARNPNIVKKITTSLTSWSDIIGAAEGIAGKVAGKPEFRLGLFDRQRYPAMRTGRADEAYIRAPSGEVYTWDWTARYAHENGLEATRHRVEIARDVIQEMRQRQSGTLYGMVRGGLVAWQRAIQEISHTFEVAARVGVLVDGLQSGKTPPEALADARAAVLDYGRMTAFEQGMLRLVVPFWAFNKANQMSFMRAALKHPERIRQQLEGIQATWDAAGISEEERSNWSEYQTGRIALATLSEDGAVFRKDGSIDVRHRAVGLFSPSFSNPQALSLMFDMANLIAAFFAPEGVVGVPGATSESFESSFEDLLRNANPLGQLAVNCFKFYTENDKNKGVNRKLVVSPALMNLKPFSEFITTNFPVRKVFYDPDNDKWAEPSMYSRDKSGFMTMYVIEGALAQAAYVTFVDVFGRELARPAAFASFLGSWDQQMQYTRKDYLEAERGINVRRLPGVQQELIDTELRVNQTAQERRLLDLENMVQDIREGTPY